MEPREISAVRHRPDQFNSKFAECYAILTSPPSVTECPRFLFVTIVGSSCFVYREDGDPVFRPSTSKSSWSPPGWYGAESRLLHHVKLILNRRGYDLIKKRMWKDGHLFGTEHTQYLRSRSSKSVPSLCIYHADYAIEIAVEVFNKLGGVELAVEYGLMEEDDGAAAQTHTQAIEAAHPCFEISWDAPADLESGVITSGPERYRHYKGFTNRSQAEAWLRSCPGEYPILIDRCSDERLIV